MFTETEWQSLVGTLIEKTSKEEVSWVFNKNKAYQYRLDADTVLTLRSDDGDGREPYTLTVWRKGAPEGEEAAGLSAFAKLKTGDIVGEWGPIDRLDDLYRAAERQVNGASLVFQTMMDKLAGTKEGWSAPPRTE